ncbi:MAG: L-threonylcarbamoyladenylate synthase [Chitinispirillaceae bacterium]|nr:L-threonylcarbamoyladenylate synthase [Chitinispirillaceae bacterium]
MDKSEITTICQKAADIIKKGGLVAFPTETVYGLGGNAFNAVAVANIFKVKGRPSFDPLIVHIYEYSQLNLLVEEVPELALKLVKFFWPGPLTIVLPKKSGVPDIVTAGLSSVGIRMPRHPVALELLRWCDTPLAAPSANLFGRVSPTTAEHVREQLGESVDMIIDGGKCNVGIESTVISFTEEHPLLLRPGGTPIEEIEKVIGKVKIPSPTEHISSSPGRQLKHYAPLTPLLIDPLPEEITKYKRKGLLCFTKEPEKVVQEFAAVEILSPRGDLGEAAANLFAALRRLDNANLEVIVAKRVPNFGLGIAINDRLFRASNARL